MEQSTIALIIMLVTIAALIVLRISVATTLMLATAAMVVTGILPFSSALSGFASSTCWLLIALMVAGAAIEKSGLMDDVGGWLQRMGGSNEKRFVLILYILAAVTSWLVNGIVVLVVFMMIVDKVSVHTRGRITRKHCYYPIALGSSFGSLCSSVGSSAMMNVSSQLGASPFGRSFHLLETFPIGFAVTIAGFLYYATFGYSLQKKVFNWPDIPVEQDVVQSAGAATPAASGKKKVMSLAILLALIFLVAMEWLDTGFVSVAAMFAFILTGCLTEKEAYRSIDMKIVFCVVGALGFGKGIYESGAGAVVADAILSVSGSLRNSTYGMCALCLVIAAVLSSFMANNSAAAIITPIAFGIATEMNASLLPFAIACGLGVNLAVATPICRTTVTMTMGAGYSFKSLGIVGGVINLIAVLLAIAGLYVMYFI